MNAIYRLIILGFSMLIAVSDTLAQPKRDTLVFTYSDKRIPDKLSLLIDSLVLLKRVDRTENLKGMSREIDKAYGISSISNFNWDVQYNGRDRTFEGILKIKNYTAADSVRNMFLTEEYFVIIQELYCCKEKPSLCVPWNERSKYPECKEWVIQKPRKP